ncbi:MAG TPA: hydrogenase maturation nickel metallochaperone HypA [Spirochaetales bacterium]|nr:hydrogenase maturation nickel metallochaperone HypA [Spirochaetales bacterium]HRY54044.1 hydrogenase maturation nickel metallochaperone HypA [Spirochaetia bacterium]HRZ63424.1 hydrogenase maturation nickel metallochaperone HypA [Spirochaetia bacterium]
MHELAVVESVLDIALGHAAARGLTRIRSVGLQVSAASDLEEEWLARYFGYASGGTMAEGAKLRVERVPALLRCGSCSREYEVGREGLAAAACPACGSPRAELARPSYFVTDMEAS